MLLVFYMFNDEKYLNARPLLRCFLNNNLLLMNANYVLILTKENNEITFYIIDICAILIAQTESNPTFDLFA